MRIRSTLYITTQIVGSWRYFSWAAYPSIWYARLQRKIIDLALNTETDLSVKFYPNDHLKNPNINFMQGRHPEKIKQEWLPALLTKENFDLIITEAVATTLLEILCTKSQILLFAPPEFIKLYPEAVALLSKRVFIAESEDEYLDLALKLLSSDASLQPKPVNDDFLMKYGVGDLDSNPLNLAIQQLKKITDESILQ